MNFRTSLATSANKSAGILMGVALTLYCNLGIIAILTMLSFEPWTGRVFPRFRSLLVSFITFFSLQSIGFILLLLLLNLFLSILFFLMLL